VRFRVPESRSDLAGCRWWAAQAEFALDAVFQAELHVVAEVIGGVSM